MLYLPKTPAHPDARMGCTFLSNDYTVTVNGESCDVRACRVSAMPFNRVWPGHQRPVDQSEQASYMSFYGDGPVRLAVTCRRDCDSAVIRPLSKDVALTRSDSTLIFTLPGPGNYVLEPYGEHFALHIFYNAPKACPDKDSVTYFFGPGAHYPGLITLKDNDSVYIDPEAIVFGSIYSRGAKNVRVFGGGVLDDSMEERLTEASYEGHSKGCVRLYNSKNIVIEDIILLNSANWVLALFDCDTVTVKGVKITGQWRYNTDGIDLTNTSHVRLTDCFVRSFDDNIVVKAIYNHTVCEDILVENCVLWCAWGKTLELGLETAAMEYRNITYRNCDLIHNAHGAMAVSNGNYADIHDILYEDIRVEYNADAMESQIQKTDDAVYTGRPGAMAHLMRISNWKFAQGYDYITIADARDRFFGRCHDITYRNIRVTKDDGLPMPMICFASHDETVPIEHITIDGVFVNGERMTGIDCLRSDIQNARQINWR